VKGKERRRVRRMRITSRRKEERNGNKKRTERESVNLMTKRNYEKEFQIPSCVT
jgi:hypothetical protein